VGGVRKLGNSIGMVGKGNQPSKCGETQSRGRNRKSGIPNIVGERVKELAYLTVSKLVERLYMKSQEGRGGLRVDQNPSKAHTEQ